MKLVSSVKDGKLTLEVGGEIDHHGAKSAMAEIEEQIDILLPRECILDLSGVSFMDSSGIAVILKTNKRMNELGGRMSVHGVPPQPMRIIEMAGIDRLIRITSMK